MENPKKENRQRVASIILENQQLFKELISITFNIENKISIKAAWILEWICTHHHLEWILPYLDIFTSEIKNVKFDSAIRPCAKICAQLATTYYAKNKNDVQKLLTQKHIDSIVEAGFDWLITPQKIAVRAYTMNSLYYLGLEKEWVHPELKHLIETKIIHESKGCKARGSIILELIEKHRKSTL